MSASIEIVAVDRGFSKAASEFAAIVDRHASTLPAKLRNRIFDLAESSNGFLKCRLQRDSRAARGTYIERLVLEPSSRFLRLLAALRAFDRNRKHRGAPVCG